jgi:hypothetical protein
LIYKFNCFDDQVIHCSGHLLKIRDPNTSSDEPSTQLSRYFLIAIGEPIEHPNSIDKPLSLNVFVSRHSLDMKYTQVDERFDFKTIFLSLYI